MLMPIRILYGLKSNYISTIMGLNLSFQFSLKTIFFKNIFI
jgi:hypothetical protein